MAVEESVDFDDYASNCVRCEGCVGEEAVDVLVDHYHAGRDCGFKMFYCDVASDRGVCCGPEFVFDGGEIVVAGILHEGGLAEGALVDIRRFDDVDERNE